MPAEALTSAPPAEARLGFYGKLPARGDFLSRRLTRGFIDPWDGWLQDAIAQSRAQLGEAWLDAYLTAPLWRFFLAPGLCGPEAVTGVVMSSVDRVGRYFPLALAVPVDDIAPMRLLTRAASWYEQVEELALAALEDGAELDGFDAAVAAVGRPEPGDAPAIPYRLGGALGFEADDPSALSPDLLDGILAGIAAPFSLWATSGSDRVRPMLLYAAGLPPAAGFAALLDGSWERWGWMKRR